MIKSITLFQNTETLYKNLIQKLYFYHNENINNYPKHYDFKTDVRICFVGNWYSKIMPLANPKLWGYNDPQIYIQTPYLEFLAHLHQTDINSYWQSAESRNMLFQVPWWIIIPNREVSLYHTVLDKSFTPNASIIEKLNDKDYVTDIREKYNVLKIDTKKRKIKEE